MRWGGAWYGAVEGVVQLMGWCMKWHSASDGVVHGILLCSGQDGVGNKAAIRTYWKMISIEGIH